MAREFDALRSRIRDVLLNDWDPQSAAGMEAAAGTYDGYIDQLADMIRGGADEQAIVDFLHERELETMCFPSMGTQRLRRIAMLLLRVAKT